MKSVPSSTKCLFFTVLVYLCAVTGAVEFAGDTADFIGVTAGQGFTVAWEDAVGQVNLTLYKAPETLLQFANFVGYGLSGTSIYWNVPSDIPDGTYVMEITDSSGKTAFSPDFRLTNTNSVSSVSLSSSSSAYEFSLSSSSTSSATSAVTSATSSIRASSSPMNSPASPPITSSQSTHKSSSLTTGAKAGIGVGASTGGVLLLAFLGWLVFQHGKRIATQKHALGNAFEKAELNAETPLSAAEREELERRRRAAELEGVEISPPVELEGAKRDRWDLEARKKHGPVELE